MRTKRSTQEVMRLKERAIEELKQNPKLTVKEQQEKYGISTSTWYKKRDKKPMIDVQKALKPLNDAKDFKSLYIEEKSRNVKLKKVIDELLK